MNEIKFTREWAMPNKWTFGIKPIHNLIQEEMNDGLWIDPFAGKKSPANIKNDISEEANADYHMDALDFLKTFPDESVDGILYDPPYCYDENTYLLTYNGYKCITKITKDDLLATLNTDTGVMEWQQPTEIICKRYIGNMIKIKNNHINLFVTPSHRCFIAEKNNDYYWNTAEHLFDSTHEVKFLTSYINTNKKEKSILIKDLNKEININDWLIFYSIYLNCGHLNNTKTPLNKIDFYIKNKRTLNYLYYFLNKYSFIFYTENGCISVINKNLFNLFNTNQNKLINMVKNLNRELSNQFLNLYFITRKINYPNIFKCSNNYKIIISKSTQMIDDFSVVALNAGFSVDFDSLKNGYRLKIYKQKEFFVQKKSFKIVPFDGYVYCVCVPNATLFVRRKGKTCWCGNSPRQVSECYKKNGKTVNMETTQSSYWSKQKNEIARILKKGGKCISFGWNSNGIGKTRGFEIKRILLVPHGGNHNDTICTVEIKK